MAKAINAKEAQFIANFTSPKSEGFDNATVSAKLAGYSPKTAAAQGWQLLKKPKIKTEIDRIKTNCLGILDKESFTKHAMSDYQSLDVNEPNKPRFLELAGKANGIIGASEQGKSGTTINNLTQININGTESQSELLALTRKIIEGN